MEKKIRKRLEMLEYFNQLQAAKQQQEEAERVEEARFRETLMAKFAQDEKLEQMNAQKRRSAD